MLFEKQQYQIDCVDNLIRVLQGIDLAGQDFSCLQDNLRELAQEKGWGQFPIVDKKRLDVLMETGTGKTFTYLKLIFELYKRYQQKKFLIVLPRTAILLGVVQQIQQSKEYFFNEYGKHLNIIRYPDDGLNSIEQNFIGSNDLSILLLTSSSFNKKDNRINRKTETLFNFDSTWEGIESRKPIVIIDEPHLLKGEKTSNSFQQLDSLFIRFGATYPQEEEHRLSNVVYSLDSISAFNRYLVKQIGVNTIFSRSEESACHIEEIRSGKSFEAYYHINERLHKTTVRVNDDLGAKTGLDRYRGCSVVKILKNKIYLSDRTSLDTGVGNYQLSDNEIEVMVEKSIRLHFEKEEGLFDKGIKPLSLFFIPQVADFRGEVPRIKNIFEEKYRHLRQEFFNKTKHAAYRRFLDNDYRDGKLQVHEGYFAGDKGKSQEEKETQGVHLILNDKEKLISFTTPLRFIFSVWALQEGWDNPNIFTICKLAHTGKETSRRQQVGRGLRIALNQEGKRLTFNAVGEDEEKFYNINALDLVVPGQEQGFIHQIQKEISDNSFSIVGDRISLDLLRDKGLDDRESATIFSVLSGERIIDEAGIIRLPVLDFLQENRNRFATIGDQRYEEIKRIFQRNTQQAVIDKNRDPKMVTVRENKWKEFRELWETINRKAKIVYTDIQQDDLIERIRARFHEMKIEPVSNKISKEIWHTQKDRITVKETHSAPPSYFQKEDIAHYIPSLAKEENLSLAFLCKVFSNIDIEKFKGNPAQSREVLTNIIKEEIHASIIHRVNYEFGQTSIFANALQDEDGNLKKKIKYSLLGSLYNEEDPKDEFLYDTVVYDSQIEWDAITRDPTAVGDNTITVFAKLPRIQIPTPYKTYSPDFAYLIDRANDSTLFLVVETKGYDRENDIPEQERVKTDYAKRFFTALQKELPEVEIRFETRIQSGDFWAGVLKKNGR